MPTNNADVRFTGPIETFLPQDMHKVADIFARYPDRLVVVIGDKVYVADPALIDLILRNGSVESDVREKFSIPINMYSSPKDAMGMPPTVLPTTDHPVTRGMGRAAADTYLNAERVRGAAIFSGIRGLIRQQVTESFPKTKEGFEQGWRKSTKLLTLRVLNQFVIGGEKLTNEQLLEVGRSLDTVFKDTIIASLAIMARNLPQPIAAAANQLLWLQKRKIRATVEKVTGFEEAEISEMKRAELAQGWHEFANRRALINKAKELTEQNPNLSLSELLQRLHNEKLITAEMALALLYVVYQAGHDSTTAAIRSSIYELGHPDNQQTVQELIAEVNALPAEYTHTDLQRAPKLMQFIQKTLTKWPPFPVVWRRWDKPDQEFEVPGPNGTTQKVMIKQGSELYLCLSMLYRHPVVREAYAGQEAFLNTQGFELQFGSGSHACPGGPLAMTEIACTIIELLRQGFRFSHAEDVPQVHGFSLTFHPKLDRVQVVMAES